MSLEVVTNKELDFAKHGWGQDEIILDKDDMKNLKNGESLGYADGEYTHILKFKETE